MTLNELYKNSRAFSGSTIVDMRFYIRNGEMFVKRSEMTSTIWELSNKHSPDTIINTPFSGWYAEEAVHGAMGSDLLISRIRVTYDLSEEEYAAHVDINGTSNALPCVARGDLPAAPRAVGGGPCPGYIEGDIEKNYGGPCYICIGCPWLGGTDDSENQKRTKGPSRTPAATNGADDEAAPKGLLLFIKTPQRSIVMDVWNEHDPDAWKFDPARPGCDAYLDWAVSVYTEGKGMAKEFGGIFPYRTEDFSGWRDASDVLIKEKVIVSGEENDYSVTVLAGLR